MPDTPAEPRERRRRPLAFWLIGIGALYLALETLGFVAFWIATGHAFTFARADQMRAAARTGEDSTGGSASTTAEALANAALKSALAVHPYLGYVLDPTDENTRLPVSPFGFPGQFAPLRQERADHYVVAIVGGSMAFQLTLHAEATLREGLSRCEALAGKTIDIVPLAVGAYKQPQQLLTIQLLAALGGHFDCVIALDGYNEIALVEDNVRAGTPEWYPNYWPSLLDTAPSPERLRAIARILDQTETREAAARSFDALRLSPLAQFLWQARDRRLSTAIAEARAGLVNATRSTTYAQTGPGPQSGDVAAARERMVTLWRECSQMLHAFCVSRGARYFHFLQPNQYVADSKPMGPLEASVARIDTPLTRAVREYYPRLVEAGEQLRAQSVAFTDLTRMFAEHPEALYIDNCCHLGIAGNTLLAAKIAATIRAELDFAGITLTGLEVVPTELEFTSPFEGSRLILTARGDDGRDHQLDPQTTGLALVSEPAGALEVTPDGRIRAVRRGASRLRIEFRGTTRAIPTRADWPEVMTGDDEFLDPSLGTTPPRLTIDPATVRKAAGMLGLRGTDLPITGIRLLVTGTRPPPSTLLGLEHAEFITLPFGAGTPSHDLEVPVPPADGSSLYFRIYVVGEDRSKVLARSRCVALTRR